MTYERGLHGMELVGCPQPLDRLHLVALMLDGKAEAGVDPFAVDDDGAGPALPVIAALLRAGELQMLAQCIEQRRARVEIEVTTLTVDGE